MNHRVIRRVHLTKITELITHRYRETGTEYTIQAQNYRVIRTPRSTQPHAHTTHSRTIAQYTAHSLTLTRKQPHTDTVHSTHPHAHTAHSGTLIMSPTVAPRFSRVKTTSSSSSLLLHTTKRNTHLSHHHPRSNDTVYFHLLTSLGTLARLVSLKFKLSSKLSLKHMTSPPSVREVLETSPATVRKHSTTLVRSGE